jgi:hypothetical protein
VEGPEGARGAVVVDAGAVAVAMAEFEVVLLELKGSRCKWEEKT